MSRIDWKYVLGLELTDPGFDASVLCEFRGRLIAGGTERVLFESLLARLQAAGLIKPRGRQRTDSTHVLAAVHTLSWLELIGETIRYALNRLAVIEPEWLRGQLPPERVERYGSAVEEFRLPTSQAERTALAVQIGQDGQRLLAALYAPTAPSWLRQSPAVEILRQVWVPQFEPHEDGPRWRRAGNLLPVGIAICSPYDAEARYSQKRQTEWTRYKVHLTETCEADQPLLITDVQTTPAPWLGAQLWERSNPRLPFWITVLIALVTILPTWFKFKLPKPAEVAVPETG